MGSRHKRKRKMVSQVPNCFSLCLSSISDTKLHNPTHFLHMCRLCRLRCKHLGAIGQGWVQGLHQEEFGVQPVAVKYGVYTKVFIRWGLGEEQLFHFDFKWVHWRAWFTQNMSLGAAWVQGCTHWHLVGEAWERGLPFDFKWLHWGTRFTTRIWLGAAWVQGCTHWHSLGEARVCNLGT